MDEKMLQDLKKQHEDNYKNALIDTIQNNTNALVEDDLMPLFIKPPLDSMDTIRNKMLSLAKKHRIVLDSDKLDLLLDGFRKDIIHCCDEIKKIRIKYLIEIINNYKIKEFDYIVFYKKDFISLNKKMKLIVKNQLDHSIESKLLDKIHSILSSSSEESHFDIFIQEETKYMKKNYQKQLLDSFDIKLLVKDTTLINSIKEQGERYIFTLKNSRVLNDFE